MEITLLEPVADGWCALAKPLRKLREGEVIRFSDQLSATVSQRGETDLRLAFNLTGPDFDAALAEAPYIAAKRAADDQDKDDYQTVFARHAGAVAAPTASLHFETWLLEALAAKGVAFTEVTLHVGAGTFLPVKVEDVTTHRMHAEWGQVTPAAAAEINATKDAGGRVIPVGTTALRLIESAARTGKVQPWEGPTDIFIYPGFQFRVTDKGAAMGRPDGHLHLSRLSVPRHGRADDEFSPAEVHASDAGIGADGQGADRPHL